MSAEIIDGAKIAQDVRNEVTQGVVELQARHGIVPGLAAFLVGDNPASAIYVRNKQRACQEAGIFSETFNLPSDITQDELIERVLAVNQDDRFHGILVQLPLPPQIDESSVILALDPDKDVDGLHPVNVGRMVKGEPIFVPCTPVGIQQLLLRTGNSPDGKKVVVCGRSEIVGKPIAILMMQKREGANATVTVCHTGTKDLAEVTRSADILVAAMGRARAITADMVKEGVVVIDVGINRVEDLTRKRGYRLEGDVDFEEVSKKAAAITPVPGGVGPMTVAMLLLNTLEAAQRKALVTTSHR
ncbi:bifunctional methylenetetrahydrofolate dehydrogenase/methenyltetrahydrofolate cyclohydrolase FolD [SAR202 cluster bacterium AC-647-N09_OGT_505m]|nr:bifunctional methylenetetrahydrofolate dehydrogenase/methenyltetrahydrofolate cyclohydrolase FolD [SAR202 cluster bacterium AC-647-N09_OGT_505m]